jgi:hypothetical protein
MVEEPSKPAEPTKERLSLFRDTSGSIKTLRKFYKKNPTPPSLDELLGESDRSSILLMATILDDVLQYRLEKSLGFSASEDEIDYIFRFEGPLGTFSSRMEIALLFGFIDDVTFQQLNIVREVRNACAHSMHPMVFSEPAVVNVIKRMFFPLGAVGVPSDRRDTVKKGFVIEGSVVYATLFYGSRKIGIEKIAAIFPLAPDDFSWPSPNKSP